MPKEPTRLDLPLSYSHAPGDLSDYYDALAAGRARASRCPKCGDVRMPPRLTCTRDGAETEQTALSGRGTVKAATFGSALPPFGAEAEPRTFVLVAMDGADNLMFGRMDIAVEDIAPGTEVRLAGGAGAEKHPGEAAIFTRYDAK